MQAGKGMTIHPSNDQRYRKVIYPSICAGEKGNDHPPIHQPTIILLLSIIIIIIIISLRSGSFIQLHHHSHRHRHRHQARMFKSSPYKEESYLPDEPKRL